MKKLLLLLMALGLLISCATEQTSSYEEENTTTTTEKSRQKRENDLSKKNIKGKVKERAVWVYAPDATGKIDKNALMGGVEVTYNKDGNQLTWKSYDEQKQLLDAWVYTYNEQGLLKEEKTVNGPVVRQLYYRYNPQHQLEQSKEHTNGALVKTTNYQYDEQGNLVLSHSFFEASKSESKRKQRFNANNQLVELQVYDEANVVQLKKVYGYNEQGQQSEQAIYSGNNVPSYKRQFIYDEQGNPVKDWAYLEDGQLSEKDAFNYQYTYDEQGNWLTKTKTDTNGQPLEYSTQTLVYF